MAKQLHKMAAGNRWTSWLHGKCEVAITIVQKQNGNHLEALTCVPNSNKAHHTGIPQAVLLNC